MISVIMPVTGPSRVKNVETVTKFLARQTYKNFELIIVEQLGAMLNGKNMRGPHYKHINSTKYLPLRAKRNNLFSPAWMCNCGVTVAKGNIFLFLDTDLVFDRNYLEKISKFNKGFFFSFDRVFHLTKNVSQNVINKLRITQEDLHGATMYYSGSLLHPGYAPCAQRSFFLNSLGGYNENYLGWGGLDNDIAWRARSLQGQDFKLNNSIYHLWHPRTHAKTAKVIMNTWRTTWKHPEKINDRLKKAKLGKREGPTKIDIKDIFIRWYK